MPYKRHYPGPDTREEHPAGNLDEYRKKRDFEVTPEPGPELPAGREGDPRFVIQEHHATALHWDFRLERDGVLVSWAVPKGLPLDPKTNHRAIHTEDHPMEYLNFEGDIPKGEYGGGKVTVWDTGTYETHKFLDREVMVTLHGRRAEGKYILFQTDGKNWMVHRMDPPLDPTREQMPAHVAPMLATLAKDPPPASDDRWAFEVKWDGVRAIVYSQGGRVRTESRNRNDITPQFPEMRELGKEIGALKLVLDGEIVAFDESGRPSFERLQKRLGVAKESQVRRLVGSVPVAYVIFDLLYVDGHSTLALPYKDRRALLEKLDLNGESWRTPGYHEDGATLLEAIKEQGLEGIVAKRLDSAYEPGRRSPCWLKVKSHLRQDFLVGGWTPRQGAGDFGALLLGYYERPWSEPGAQMPPFRFAGRAGTGFTEAVASKIFARLAPLEIDYNPFHGGGIDIPQGSRFCRPELVVNVEFTGWTNAAVLRHPSYKGTVEDKTPADVVREDVSSEPEG